MGYHSLTTTTHPSKVNLPFSGQQNTTRLSARKVSVAGRNRAQDPMLRDTTGYWGLFPPEQSGSGMIQISHIHLITRLTKSGATSPFPRITSGRARDSITPHGLSSDLPLLVIFILHSFRCFISRNARKELRLYFRLRNLH